MPNNLNRLRSDPERFEKLVRVAARKGREHGGLSAEAYLYKVIAGQLPPIDAHEVDAEPLS